MSSGKIDGKICYEVLKKCQVPHLRNQLEDIMGSLSTMKRFIGQSGEGSKWPTRVDYEGSVYKKFYKFFLEQVRGHYDSVDDFKIDIVTIFKENNIEQDIIDKINRTNQSDIIIKFIVECARSNGNVPPVEEIFMPSMDESSFSYLQEEREFINYYKQLKGQAKKPDNTAFPDSWERVKENFEKLIRFTRVHYQTLARLLPKMEPDEYSPSVCICNEEHFPLFFAEFLTNYADYLLGYPEYSMEIIHRECLLERVRGLLNESKKICEETRVRDNFIEETGSQPTVILLSKIEMLDVETKSQENELKFERENVDKLDYRRRNGNKTEAENTCRSYLLINTRQNEYCFTPVCSSVFDSVAGKDAQNLQEVQQKIFQLAASGKTLLLQPPQVMDNRTMLTLLNKSEPFRVLCREGIVSFSSFSIGDKNLCSPEEYLIYSLNNPDFNFSSTELYHNPEIRTNMKNKIIEGNSRFLDQFPLENRDEIAFLYEGYQHAKECFSASNIRKYHQNSQYRFPSYNKLVACKKQIILSVMIEEYLNMLKKDYRFMSEERKGFLDSLIAINEHILKTIHSAQITTRSEYDTQIVQLKEQRTFEDHLLESFKKVVYYCYHVTNGLRSCNQLWIPQIDDDRLCIHSLDKGNCFISKDKESLINQKFQQFKGTTTQKYTLMDMENIMDVTMGARRIYWENRNKSTDERNLCMENELEILFSGDSIATSYRTKTLDGTVTAFSNEKTPDACPENNDIYNLNVD